MCCHIWCQIIENYWSKIFWKKVTDWLQLQILIRKQLFYVAPLVNFRLIHLIRVLEAFNILYILRIENGLIIMSSVLQMQCWKVCNISKSDELPLKLQIVSKMYIFIMIGLIIQSNFKVSQLDNFFPPYSLL